MTTLAHRRTRFAHVWMQLVSEPFIALMTVLAFIMRKNLGASAFELALFAAARPVMGVFSFYWSANLIRHPEKLRSNLIWAWILSRAPFFLLPLFPTIGYAIFCSASYYLFYRAGTPALIELLKLNIPKESREKVFSWTFAAGFIECIFLSLFLGKLLEIHGYAWKWLFAASSLLTLTSVFFQNRIPSAEAPKEKPKLPPIKQRLLDPWKLSYQLIRENREFAQFQWGFMIGGFGLMVMAPAYPIYFADVLQLGHEQVTLARCLWMSVGVMLSSQLWRMAMKQLKPAKLTAAICAGFALFPLSLLMARYEVVWFYLAFLFYGIAQAGSHLLWNLSGTLFSGEKNSASYTAVNVLTVGLRGLIGPFLGGLICQISGPTLTLVVGMSCCLYSAYLMMRGRLIKEKFAIDRP